MAFIRRIKKNKSIYLAEEALAKVIKQENFLR
jgi:hypothetical protein